MKMKDKNLLFATRLRNLRDLEGLTIYQLSKNTGISETSISNYEAGDQEPTLSVITKFSVFFKCTSDYLIGITDDSKLSSTAFECAKMIDSMNRFEQDWTFILVDAIKTKVETLRRDRRFLSEGFLKELNR